MKEQITNELVEYFAQKYEEYVNAIEAFDDELVFTFEQFVERELLLRKFQTRKALGYSGKKAKEKEQA